MFNSKKIARAGIISAIYIVLSLITFPVSSGAVQIRIAEGLTILALFYAESIFALTVGCAVINLITGCPIYDVVFGSLITLISAILTFYIGNCVKNNKLKFVVGGIFPIILNATLLPLIWYYCYGELEYIYILSFSLVLVGEGVSVYLFGGLIYTSIIKLKNKGINFLN